MAERFSRFQEAFRVGKQWSGAALECHGIALRSFSVPAHLF